MNERDPVKAILAPFLVHGLCKNETEALRMLAKDYVQRQVGRYGERVAQFHELYQTSVEQFTQQVAALCQGGEEIPALRHLDRQEQIVRAEDDLEEWQAAEQYLACWSAIDLEQVLHALQQFPEGSNTQYASRYPRCLCVHLMPHYASDPTHRLVARRRV
jgi:hypothetical protein